LIRTAERTGRRRVAAVRRRHARCAGGTGDQSAGCEELASEPLLSTGRPENPNLWSAPTGLGLGTMHRAVGGIYGGKNEQSGR
jgi:hypothetical protein